MKKETTKEENNKNIEDVSVGMRIYVIVVLVLFVLFLFEIGIEGIITIGLAAACIEIFIKANEYLMK